ncbi:alkylated DNA repair protein ALKBH8 homolog isoform X2 [Diospyros lotus]|uniref:alkylated DNA repair protein ALKBH8 homolog isoform X2 n=1 Tax=Diospyros lotus TaxID=55363 RepID=UPI002255EFAC|nr:alkylated DNA repair protein ALKBH8 homolog isoform X2 [Diospyros lotus]
MGLPRFGRPIDGKSSPNLYVANCGPAVGLSFNTIATVFSTFGEVIGVYAADESGTRVIVSYVEESSAQAALKALNKRPCPDLAGRFLHIQYSIVQPPKQVLTNDSIPVSLAAKDLNIPGLYLWPEFITSAEEEELLASVDDMPWKTLAKRRVQHYGYEFIYEVNEYPSGVGLSPHIDTHSAFDGLIFSLSLAGPCIMEFRRYTDGAWLQKPDLDADSKEENSDCGSNFVRRAIYLPPRSMLLFSGEARYAWHHYIPHHKVDLVKDNVIKRGSRRVSFTLRKVREGPCKCEFPQYCDSQS